VQPTQKKAQVEDDLYDDEMSIDYDDEQDEPGAQ
jgi:hypothetical protein